MAARTKKYPPIPKEIDGTGGKIAVKTHKGIIKIAGEDKGEAWGCWERHTRTIMISDQCPPRFRWWVFMHECTHAAIDDSGLHNMLSGEMQEALCDAIATQQTKLRFD